MRKMTARPMWLAVCLSFLAAFAAQAEISRAPSPGPARATQPAAATAGAALAQVRTPPPLPATSSATSPAMPAPPMRPPGPDIEGTFRVAGDTTAVRIRRLSGDIFLLDSSEGWHGVGILDGSIYRGVFRYRSDLHSAMSGVVGRHTIDWSVPGEPTVQTTFENARSGQADQRWQRIESPREWRRIKPMPPPRSVPPDAPPGPGKPAPPPEATPPTDEYVYVDQLPEAITKLDPVYPHEPGVQRIEGVVLVQARVLEDGTVGECRIQKSVPMLDEAAIACVRQWRFKPALANGKPVAVWVAIPVRFSLK